MTEILTESFCERCGTRYTFESARPKIRLRGVKTVSRGLKNFVLSDGTSMDEAMAAARSETDREATAYQLDAFHKTFNFCMSCRQYTCPNCWNEAEARCLTCAPHLGHEVLPAPFPDLPASGVVPVNDPTGDGAILVNGLNGRHSAEPVATEDMDSGVDIAARLAALTTFSEPLAAPLDPVAEAEAEVEPATEVDAEAVATQAAEVDTEDHDAARLAALAAAEALIEPGVADEAPLAEAPAGKSRSRFRRFRPDQDLDAELDAYEREQAAVAAASAAAVVPGESEVAAEPVIAADSVVAPGAVVEPEIEAVVADVVAERGVAAAEPVEAEAVMVIEAEAVTAPAAEPAAETELVADAGTEPAVEPGAVEAAPEPASAPMADDVIAQPTWRMVAPESTADEAAAAATPELPAAATVADPGTEPQWPTRPAWLASAPSVGLPFLGRPAAPQGGLDALWAESDREVASPRSTAKPAGGVQPCVSCGLSLSGTARFCRRCGTPQVVG